jgi:hypothetical protein
MNSSYIFLLHSNFFPVFENNNRYLVHYVEIDTDMSINRYIRRHCYTSGSIFQMELKKQGVNVNWPQDSVQSLLF